MKEYRVRVLLQSGGPSYFSVDHMIKGQLADIGRNHYKFVDETGKESYYPTASTIIEEV
jgi:hypothetical protein